MGDTPTGMSGIYPRTSSQDDLHAATISQARVLDSYLATFRSNAGRLTALEARSTQLELDVDTLQAEKTARDAVSKATLLYIVGGFSLITLIINVATAILLKH